MQSVNSSTKFGVSFLMLFVLYHAAEYMIVFQGSPAGFFLFQLLFFVSAWLLGQAYGANGLANWGLPFVAKSSKLFLMGIGLGCILYAVPYALSLYLGIEFVIRVPAGVPLIKSALPFAFGVLFSSFSEDILTRGLIYRHFNARLKPLGLVLLSASVYVLNHIYRLTDGPEAWMYLFLLGAVFIIPVIFTKNLWLTGGMHWAGNTFFFVTHSVIQTQESSRYLSPNYLFAAWLLVFLPLLGYLCRRLTRPPQTPPAAFFLNPVSHES